MLAGPREYQKALESVLAATREISPECYWTKGQCAVLFSPEAQRRQSAGLADRSTQDFSGPIAAQNEVSAGRLLHEVYQMLIRIRRQFPYTISSATFCASHAFLGQREIREDEGMIARPIHVAILDDDPSIRTALGRLLVAVGMAVDASDTSDQFLESVALKRPDCLLLDLQMPGISGLDVLKDLNQRNIRIPTIVITGSNATDCHSECLNAGAITCLRKPLDAEQLIQTINRASESSTSTRSRPSVWPGTNAGGAAPFAQLRR
jgi:CheY-like chemotaxis protein